MDTWSSSRSKNPRQLDARCPIPTPLEEDRFENLTAATVRQGVLHGPEARSSSIWGRIIVINETFAEVFNLMWEALELPPHSPTIESKVRELTLRLDRWNAELPEHLQLHPENIETFRLRGRLQELAVPHLIYHHQCQLLYFQYLAQDPPSMGETVDSAARRYVDRCKAHAEALSDLMWIANTTSGMECLWSPVNGHLVVVASTVLLHSILFNEVAEQITKVKRLLERNFIMLLQFERYWPTLEGSFARLQAFHRSCEQGDRTMTFQTNAWMLEYLTRYDMVVHDNVNLARC